MDPKGVMLQVGFSCVAIVVALIGVLMQNDALRYAELGDPPDHGGSMFLGGAPDSPYEISKRFFMDLRAHYRRASATLASTANFVLLLSVVAGVLAGFTANVFIATGLAVLWMAAAIFLIRFVTKRRKDMHEREAELDSRRVDYNTKNHDGMAKTMGEEYAKSGFQPIPPFERVRW